MKIFGRPREDGLLVPITLLPIAERLTRTELRPGTANNDINALRSMEGGVRAYMAVDYLTSNFAWFLLTQNEGLLFFVRDEFESDMWVDNLTDNLLVKAYERAVPQYNDPRCAYGSFPTS